MHESFDTVDVLKKAQEMIGIAQRPVVCSACGKVLATLTNGWNMYFSCGVGVPGSPDISAFGCAEHWACSPACWLKVAHACVDQHLHDVMIEAHNQLEEKRVQLQKQVDRMKEENNVNSSHEV